VTGRRRLGHSGSVATSPAVLPLSIGIGAALASRPDRRDTGEPRRGPPPIPVRASPPGAPLAPVVPPGVEPSTVTAVLDLPAIYDQHADFVWRSLRRLGVPERSVDDAVQDVFIVVHRRLGEFEGRSTLKSWLFGIARRVAHDHRRRIGRKERDEELPEVVADPAGTTPALEAERAEAVRALHAILASLDDDKREVFILAELEQMTAPEIAAALGVNLNTIYSRLRAARAAFDAAVARHLARSGGGR
jgi:RNA polymerase sigma-70 factor (ECF subfamily)